MATPEQLLGNELASLIFALQDTNDYQFAPTDDDLTAILQRSELSFRVEEVLTDLQQRLEEQLITTHDIEPRIYVLTQLLDFYDNKMAYQFTQGVEPAQELLASRALYEAQLQAARDESAKAREPTVKDEEASADDQTMSSEDFINGSRVKHDSVAKDETGLDDEALHRECIACTDMRVVERAGCEDVDHVYCHHCLRNVVQEAVRNEQRWPPRCCGSAFSEDLIRASLTAAEFARFQQARVVYSTRADQRVYCSIPHCHTFIPIDRHRNDIAICPSETCRAHTCTICRGAAHLGDCPQDEDLQATLAMAEQNGWRRCTQCRALVERNLGCNHMTCRCRHEFCYLCGQVWRTCNCDRYDHEALHRTAQNVVDRQARQAGEILAPRERHGRIRIMRMELNDRHECEHSETFQRMDNTRPGPTCDFCGKRFNLRFLRCRWCHIEVCYGCRRNYLNRHYTIVEDA